MRKMHKILWTTAVVMAAATGSRPLYAQTDVVRLGVINDRSGMYADYTGIGSEVSVQMAVEDVGGKAAGKTVEVIGADSQNKVDIASAMVRRWFDTQNLVAFVDGGGSATALAAQGVAVEKGGTALITGGYSSEFTNKACTNISSQWVPDTYALSSAIVKGIVQSGGNSWFFITSDYAGGISIEETTAKLVHNAGGKVLGRTRHPFANMDFASFLLQAQSSGADVVGIASAGGDLVNTIKQAQEFGLTGSKQRVLTFVTFINDILGLGLDMAQGMVFPTAFYWDTDEDTRAFTRRWQEKMGVTRPPTTTQAASYVAALHYLQAADAAGTFDGAIVNQKMRDMPVTSKLLKNAWIRPEDGRVMMDVSIVQVKKPTESRYPGDFYRVLSTIPGERAFHTLAESACPLVSR